MGRVKASTGQEPWTGCHQGLYKGADVDGAAWYVHVLVCLAFGKVIPIGHQVDHLDEDKHNNRLDNLIPRSKRDHAAKTRADNPQAGRALGLTLSGMFRLDAPVDHPNHGQAKTSTEWGEIFGTRPGQVSQAAGKGHRLLRKYTLSCVEAEIHEGEREMTSAVMSSDGSPLPFTVSSYGRFWAPRARKWVEPRGYEGQVQIGDRRIAVYVLVHLAATGLMEPPIGPDGKRMTVDHVDKRRGTTEFQRRWPHRADNLRWATAPEQNANRDAL
jgi:hypothetical protein